MITHLTPFAKADEPGEETPEEAAPLAEVAPKRIPAAIADCRAAPTATTSLVAHTYYVGPVPEHTVTCLSSTYNV